jgi:integrase
MAKKIGLKEVRALGLDAVIWDETVAGFGARRRQTEAVWYFVKYRSEGGRQRWQTIGRHGSPWTPEMARNEAKRILGEVVKGADPAAEKKASREALTVAELCDAYLADAKAGRLLTRRRQAKKPSTLVTDRGRIERHIKPLLGRLAVNAVTRRDIERFMHAVAEGETAARIKTGRRGLAVVEGGKGTATRTVGFLGGVFSYAVRREVRPDNPVHGVVRFADGRRERRLSDEEYGLLGEALREAEAARIWPPAIGTARFLALSGWRSGEALNLRWSEVDLVRRTARLADTKTGFSLRPLAHAACDVLGVMPRIGVSEFVFPATRESGRMTGFPKLWARIAKLRNLPTEISPHTLRHSFASLAADLGYSEPTIAALVGHKGRSVTSRYLHSADAVLLAAADAVANRTAELMGEARSDCTVVDLRRKAS